MPKFRSKPKTITAVQIREDNKAEWPGTVSQNELLGLYVYNQLHDSSIALKFGDFVRIDDPNDNYPIDAAYMEGNYEKVKEDDNANT